MPKRKSTVRIDSDDVQGGGSWVRVRKMTWRQVKDIARRAEDDSVDAFEMNDQMLKEQVVAWNWCDEDGQPLPEPGAEGVFDDLTDEEFTFLIEAISGSEERRKN